MPEEKQKELRPLILEFYLVQDFTKGEDRLARQDGAYKVFPPGSLLPVIKAEKVKLVKEIDEPEVVREFVFSFEFPGSAVRSECWPPLPSVAA